jgi:hypothetical protein
MPGACTSPVIPKDISLLSYSRFLLPQLYLDSIKAKKKKRDIRLALQNLSRDLKPVYENAMKRILRQNLEDVDLAHKVLSWIFHALRPLAVEEIQYALAVEPGQKELDKECLIDEDDIVSVCAGLVMIDQGRGVIHFVHQTVQEYLQSVQTDQFPIAQCWNHKNKVVIVCAA